jgi:hypothetical protein
MYNRLKHNDANGASQTHNHPRDARMAEMIIIEEHNQDDMSRKAGCYLYADTQLWLEDNRPHRANGPAVIFPDGALRWYIQGKEVTRDVNTFFLQNKWPISRGLDTSEKCAQFASHFLI